MDLPAVVTTDLRLNEPRYIALPGIIKARNKPLERRAPHGGFSPKTKVTAYGAPPPRPSGRKVGSIAELIIELRSRGVLS